MPGFQYPVGGGGGGGGGNAALDRTFFVSDARGSDATGDGSITKPYKTIAFAFSQIPPHGNSYSVWAFERWTIWCEAGHYTEAGPIVFTQKRRSIRLYGDAATIDAQVQFDNDIADYPDGALFNPALVPNPWGPPSNAIPLVCFEIEGSGGAIEGGLPANNITLLGRVLYRVVSALVGPIGPVFWFANHVQSMAGWEYENTSGVFCSLTTELNESSIVNRHMGGGSALAGMNLKAHASQLRATIGPFCNILKIDTCRVLRIDRTEDFAGGVVAGSVVGSAALDQSYITDCDFPGSVYRFGAIGGGPGINIDDVSLKRLNFAGFTLTGITFILSDRQLRLNRTIVGGAVPVLIAVADKICLLDCSVGAGAKTFVLPPAASCRFDTLTVMKIDASANNAIIDGSGAETINGLLTTVILGQYESLDLYSDGTQWLIVAAHTQFGCVFGYGAIAGGVNNRSLIRWGRGSEADETVGSTAATIQASRPGILKNLYVHRVVAAGVGNTITFTVRVNGVDTAIVATLTGGVALDATDLVNTAVIAQGDLVEIKVNVTAGVPASFVTRADLELANP